jgi:acetyltransferase-like isoleucine patch superfamily enzyme
MPWLPYFMRGSRIGKYCSLGADIKFAFFGKHDYDLVTTYPFTAFYNKWKTDTPNCPTYHEGSIIESKIQPAPIIVENDVWISNKVTIRQGVTVGSGAVIALNSLVVKDVPPYAIVGGNPAKIIKYRFKPQQIENLLQISWWNWSDDEVASILPLLLSYDIDKFIEVAKKKNKS